MERRAYNPAWNLSQSRSEIGAAGLMTDDFVFYQVGSALRCADSITGNLVWERRNVRSSYSLQGDAQYLVAVARNDPNDPAGLILRTDTGSEIFPASSVLPVRCRTIGKAGER